MGTAKSRYHRARIGSKTDVRCEDCGEVEGKDHELECERWTNVRRHLYVEKLEDLADEERMLKYLQIMRQTWFTPEVEP